MGWWPYRCPTCNCRFFLSLRQIEESPASLDLSIDTSYLDPSDVFPIAPASHLIIERQEIRRVH
jgi:hypothetical protein